MPDSDSLTLHARLPAETTQVLRVLLRLDLLDLGSVDGYLPGSRLAGANNLGDRSSSVFVKTLLFCLNAPRTRGYPELSLEMFKV